eukprot:4809629-Ditylum_brightwellii.AAC.1
MSPTAAYTSLPSPYVNKAFTPNSGRAFTPTQVNTGNIHKEIFNPGIRHVLLNLLDAQDVKQTQRVN